MQASLEKLMLLPDHVRVQPGHGPATTIGEERGDQPLPRGIGLHAEKMVL